jgi:polyhydroxyalkanoate synthase subunit PhaC
MTPAAPRSPADLIAELKREAQRSILRGRNGIRYVTGSSRARVGQTPREMVWKRDKVELFRYPNAGVTQAQPLLLVMSVVTRTYIFDLLPGDSIVERMLAAGFDVFLIDWGVPDQADSHNTLETYVDGYLPLAVEAVCEETGQPGVGVLGYCLGGDLALLSLAANPEVPIHNLALMATPIDFSVMGLPVSLIREGRLDPDVLVDHTGNVPARVILNSFRLRSPTGELVQYVSLLEQLWNDEYVRSYQALNQWIHDHIPFPGALARQMVDLLVRRNQLMKGQLRLGGRRVRLKAVTCPVLNVVAEKDDVVPVASARPVRALVGSDDFEELQVNAGHVALVTGRIGHTRTIPGIIDWFVRHPLEAGA